MKGPRSPRRSLAWRSLVAVFSCSLAIGVAAQSSIPPKVASNGSVMHCSGLVNSIDDEPAPAPSNQVDPRRIALAAAQQSAKAGSAKSNRKRHKPEQPSAARSIRAHEFKVARDQRLKGILIGQTSTVAARAEQSHVATAKPEGTQRGQGESVKAKTEERPEAIAKSEGTQRAQIVKRRAVALESGEGSISRPEGAQSGSLAPAPDTISGGKPISTMDEPQELVAEMLGANAAKDLFPKDDPRTSSDLQSVSGQAICDTQVTTQGPKQPQQSKQAKPAKPQTPPVATPAPASPPQQAPPANAQPPAPTPPVQAVNAQGQPIFTNSYTDTDIKQAFADLAAAANVSISPDDSVSGNVTANYKNATVEQALDILTVSGGYSLKQVSPGVYLVGKSDVKSPNFLRFAQTRIYHPNYETAEYIAGLLPDSMKDYVKAVTGGRTLTITANPTMMERIFHDIFELDQPRVKVQLEALVTEIDETHGNVFNFSWNWKYFGLNTDGVSSNTLSYAQVSSEDVATIKAAINAGKVEIKASPRVLTMDGDQAQFEVAQQQYFEALSGPTTGLAYSQIQEIKTGITLKVTPYVASDGEITMVLAPEVSDVSGTTSAGLPITTVRSANTTVRVRDGETLVIGGMQYVNNVNTNTKVPILGDIPLIGNLFRYYDHEKQKTEVVIMITPRIVKENPGS